MRTVVHLIPYNGIGGVESASASIDGCVQGDIQIVRQFVFEKVRDRSGRLATFNPLTMWNAAGMLAKSQPSLIVLSLWRSVLVGALARLRGCRVPMVLFLHNARDAHAIDRWVTRAAARRASAIWFDSHQTRKSRLSLPAGIPNRVISFLVESRPVAREDARDPEPVFVSWGRLAAQKDPIRMIALFADVTKLQPNARLILIGPDGGMKDKVAAEIERFQLKDAVTVLGPLDWSSIRDVAANASFFLQTSKYEGMALSVIEAMQIGLVPIVAPVGEIINYTRHGMNALWLGKMRDTDRKSAEQIVDLVRSPDKWRVLRAQAIDTWSDAPLYADDFFAACRDTLEAQK